VSKLKRIFDLVVAGIGLVMLLPWFVLVIILIRLDDGGPAFFRQVRVGHNGKPFRIWKFRTMRVDAEQRGGLVTAAGDPRVTRVGRLLRRVKFDELPQLMNVVGGEMSLVGPRPEVPYYVEQYSEGQRRVLNLMPGITDPASVAFRDEEMVLAHFDDQEAAYVREIMPEKIRLNLEYAKHATLWGDIGVILKTLGVLGPLRRGGVK